MHWKRWKRFLKIHNFRQIAKFPTASENSARNIQCGHSIIRQVCWQTHGHADQRLTRGQTSHWPAGHSAKSAPTANCGLSVVVCPPPLVTARNALRCDWPLSSHGLTTRERDITLARCWGNVLRLSHHRARVWSSSPAAVESQFLWFSVDKYILQESFLALVYQHLWIPLYKCKLQ